jgi:tRNA pseudouridine55 synthase
VHRFEQLWRDQSPPPGDQLPRAGFEIECGSGTYVRSLIADLGDAYCLELRRTAIGPFEVAEAIAPPARDERWDTAPPDGPGSAAGAIVALDRALELIRH